jgi:hypothetical protein
MFWDTKAKKLVYSDSAEFDERSFPGASMPVEDMPNLLPDIVIPLMRPNESALTLPMMPERSIDDSPQTAQQPDILRPVAPIDIPELLAANPEPAPAPAPAPTPPVPTTTIPR